MTKRPPSRIRAKRLICTLFAFSVTGAPLSAGDWPQILGPHRTGAADEEELADRWPEAGPAVLWRVEVGSSHAGVAVQGSIGVLFHRLGDEEVVQGFDVRTGGRLWARSYPTNFAPQVGGEDGPLCVPTIVGEKVVTFGAQGVLSCWDLRTGEQRWQHNTHAEYDAREGYFGAGSSPIVEGHRVIVNVGGIRTGAGIVAFHLDDGRVLWKLTSEGPSYSAPVAADINDQRHVIVVTRLTCVSVDPDEGRIRFTIPFGRRGATVNGASPVLIGNHLFLTASYGIGAVLADISTSGASEQYRRLDVLASQYTTPILHQGALFGIDGRDDIPPAHLKCLDPITGRALWTEENFGYATLIKADEKLLIVTTDGQLVLARPNRDRYEELSRFALTSKTLRALPALSEGHLFVRDSDTLYCLNVAP